MVLVYPILVAILYCKSRFIGVGAMTYTTTSLRGIGIEVKVDKICHILRIPTVGACIYETKTWPHMGWDSYQEKLSNDYLFGTCLQYG